MRIQELVKSFGGNGSLHSICAGSFGPAMQRIGEIVRTNLTDCLDGPLLDTDASAPGVQPDCAVTEAVVSGSGTIRRALPACASGTTPCWSILSPGDPRSRCGARPQLDVQRKDPAAPGTSVTVKCATSTQ
jgi:hypothetical protein